MKKIFLLAICAIITTELRAQVKDTCLVKIFYKSTWATVDGDGNKYDDEQALLIGEHSSKFYSWRQKRNDFLQDSLERAGASPFDIPRVIATKGYKNSQTYCVYKNIPEEGKLIFTEDMGKKFKVEEDMPVMEWTLLDGDTTICEYSCKKAVTTYKGNTWTVWYTLDIPCSDGPWKLGGLPGVIMKADNEKGLFSFVCAGIEKGNGEVIAFDENEKYTKVTMKKIYEMKDLMTNDIGAYLERLIGGKIEDKDKIEKALGGRGKERKIAQLEY